ncbi:MAG: hypothetical protein ACLQPD_04830, partial [Desulfomonilaceae bacterium]
MSAGADQNGHCFIQRMNARPMVTEVNQIVASILNYYTGRKLSVNKYKKMERFRLVSGKNRSRSLISCRFDDFVSHIRNNRSFRHESFQLPLLHSDWLDRRPPAFSINGPISATDVNGWLSFVTEPLGDAFPIKLRIDREGVAFGTFQPALQENIIRLFNTLVNTSNLALEVG